MWISVVKYTFSNCSLFKNLYIFNKSIFYKSLNLLCAQHSNLTTSLNYLVTAHILYVAFLIISANFYLVHIFKIWVQKDKISYSIYSES